MTEEIAPTPIDDNPPQSLAEILQERMDAEAKASQQRAATTGVYHSIMRKSILLGILFGLILITIFLIKSVG